jgi:hypothetical protein
MKDKKRYIVKGTISDIEMRVAYTREGERDYGTANILTKTKNGKERKIPVLTFYPTGMDFLFMAKENSKVEVFGTFTKIKGTNGTNKFFELIGKHTKKEKKQEVPIELS